MVRTFTRRGWVSLLVVGLLAGWGLWRSSSEETVSREAERNAGPSPSKRSPPPGLTGCTPPRQPPGTALRASQAGAPPPLLGCEISLDCPSGTACIRDHETGEVRCLGSNCTADHHCPEGYVCRVLPSDPTGPRIQRCVLAGRLGEGESCQRLPRSPREACETGLICNYFFCGRPCKVEDPGSCPSGYRCHPSNDETPSCVPTCEQARCPQGRECVRLPNELAICGVLKTPSCVEAACPNGEECHARIQRDSVFMGCARPCDPANARSCPEGWVCGERASGSYCYRPCREPKDCQGGSVCDWADDLHTVRGCVL